MLIAPIVNIVAAPSVTPVLSTYSRNTKATSEDADKLLQDDPLPNSAAENSSEVNEEQTSLTFEDSAESDKVDPVLIGSSQVAHEANGHDAEITYQQVPASSLVSPPESSHDDIGHSPTAIEPTYTTSPPRSRHSSQQPHEHFQRYTPESGTIRRASHSSFGERSVEKEQIQTQSYIVASTQQADEESLRLIKELQAQDLGLRRRGGA